MAPPQTSSEHYRRQALLTLATLAAVRSTWRAMTPQFDVSWLRVGPRLLTLLRAAQLGSARSSIAYLPRLLEETGVDAPAVADVQPATFVGRASDGEDLQALLYRAVIAAKSGVASGAETREALVRGGTVLDRVVQTQVADTERMVTSVDTVTRPKLAGHIRYVGPQCCGRCAILAGRFYRWSEGFLRHENCRCTLVPVEDDPPADFYDDPMQLFREGRVRGLSQADRQAVTDGADLAQVVNVRSKKAGLIRAGRVWDRRGRPTPEAIYNVAADRDEALALLQRHGYIR